GADRGHARRSPGLELARRRPRARGRGGTAPHSLVPASQRHLHVLRELAGRPALPVRAPAGHAGGPARHGVYALIAAGLLDAGAPGKPAIAGRPARRVPYRGRDTAARLPRETPGGEPVEAECVE